jgi:hypothetical protein
VTDVTPYRVTGDTSRPQAQAHARGDFTEPEPFGAGTRGGGDEMADKKITPKSTKKSAAKKSSGEAATRVTKRKMKRARKLK